MKKWLMLLIPVFCIACSDSATDGSADAAQSADAATPAATTVEAAKPVEVVTEEIAYEVGGEPFTGFLAYNKNADGKRPGVLVVHEWWGHNDYARSRAKQLAEMGYVAFALDMYGAGKVADHPDNAMKFMQAATKDPELAKQRFLAAKSLLQSQAETDPDKIAAIGYCFGGGVVLNMARAGVDLDGVASFHGVLAPVTPATPGSVKAKVMVFNGAADPFVPQEQIDAFKAEMEAAGVDYEFINYPDVKHSFTNPGATAVGEKFEMPLAYDENADKDSWRKLAAFFDSLWPEE